jgi:hypothetical protein
LYLCPDTDGSNGVYVYTVVYNYIFTAVPFDLELLAVCFPIETVLACPVSDQYCGTGTGNAGTETGTATVLHLGLNPT